jgi:hypothetical protein
MGRFDALLSSTKPPLKPVVEDKTRTPERSQQEVEEKSAFNSPENLKTGKPESMISGKPENLKTGNQENLKNEKYSTLLQPVLIKQIKQYALEHDLKDYEVIQQAVKEYLEKNLKT